MLNDSRRLLCGVNVLVCLFFILGISGLRADSSQQDYQQGVPQSSSQGPSHSPSHSASNSPPVKRLHVGVHVSPPWSYENKAGQIVGMEKEIIEKSFRSQGYDVSFAIYGYSRLLVEFEGKHLDFASPAAMPIPGSYMTDIYLPFQDVAVTLARRHLSVNTIEDLIGRRVVAYQQAHKVLGEKYEKLVASQNSYLEQAERVSQLQMLFLQRVDAVVGERRILTFIAAENYGPNNVAVHHIFPEVHYGGVAWKKSVADAFNKGLEKLKQSGELDKILLSYH